VNDAVQRAKGCSSPLNNIAHLIGLCHISLQDKHLATQRLKRQDVLNAPTGHILLLVIG